MYETNSWQFPQAVSKTYPPSAICPYLPLDPRHRPCWPLASPGQRRMGEKMRKVIQKAAKYDVHMGMDQYLLIPFLGEWTSIYQLFWCSPGVQGFDTLPYHVLLETAMKNSWSSSDLMSSATSATCFSMLSGTTKGIGTTWSTDAQALRSCKQKSCIAIHVRCIILW